MTRLSVNLNKFALVRNSRDGDFPDLLHAAQVVINSGCDGLTLHPRADARHATLDDVLRFGQLESVRNGMVELNVEGDLRPELMRTAKYAGARQFTVVPVIPGEKTSSRGWRAYDDQQALKDAIAFFGGKTRISVFCDATMHSVDLAASAGADAVEFYTGEYARQFHTPQAEVILAGIAEAAERARAHGMQIHGGHDLDTENLPRYLQTVKTEEVSIGHAITSEALFRGLDGVLKDYLAVIREYGG